MTELFFTPLDTRAGEALADVEATGGTLGNLSRLWADEHYTEGRATTLGILAYIQGLESRIGKLESRP